MESMKILTTKARKGSVSGVLTELLTIQGHEVTNLRNGLDIRQAGFWQANTIPADTQVLINTVGVTDNDPTGSWNINRVDQVISTNLVGSIMLTEAFYNATKHNRNTKKLVIHIGSAGSRKVFTNCAPYCASKAGLAHYITCVGYELRDKNFSIIGIHPDNIAGTPMTNKVRKDLVENRNMAEEAVSKIYQRAIDTDTLSEYIVSIVNSENGWGWMTGENYYLGAGCKRGY
jgi:short-subunit dehydrogenase